MHDHPITTIIAITVLYSIGCRFVSGFNFGSKRENDKGERRSAAEEEVFLPCRVWAVLFPPRLPSSAVCVVGRPPVPAKGSRLYRLSPALCLDGERKSLSATLTRIQFDSVPCSSASTFRVTPATAYKRLRSLTTCQTRNQRPWRSRFAPSTRMYAMQYVINRFYLRRYNKWKP